MLVYAGSRARASEHTDAVPRTWPSTYFSGQRGRKELARRGRVSSRSPTRSHHPPNTCTLVARAHTHTHKHTPVPEEPHYGSTVARGCAAKEASVN